MLLQTWRFVKKGIASEKFGDIAILCVKAVFSQIITDGKSNGLL